MSDAQTQMRLLQLAAAPKAVSTSPTWSLPRQGERTARIIYPLAIDGIVVGGLSLELCVAFSRRNEFENLRVLLFAQLESKRWHIGRLEFDPPGDPPHHLNPLWACKSGLPPSIIGAHGHLADDNVVQDVADLAFSQSRDLPAARSMAGATTQHQVSTLIEQYFNLTGFWLEEDIPWDRTMF